MPNAAIPDIPNGIELRRLRAFIALITYGSLNGAADALGMTKEGVAKPIRDLQKAFGDRALTETRGIRVSATPLGEHVHRLALEILVRTETLGNLHQTLRPLTTLAYLPHHAEFVVPIFAALVDANYDVRGEVLGQHYRSIEVFQSKVIGGLERGSYDMVIGPPPAPERAHTLQSHALYTTAMMALVPVGHPDRLTFTDAANHPLLLPPEDTRAGLAIRGALSAAVDDDVTANIVQTTHETQVLVSYGLAGLGTVIVPGDIAAPFSPGGTFHSDALHRMKWVPLIDFAHATLTHTAYATIPRRAHLAAGTTDLLDLLTSEADRRRRGSFVMPPTA